MYSLLMIHPLEEEKQQNDFIYMILQILFHKFDSIVGKHGVVVVYNRNRSLVGRLCPQKGAENSTKFVVYQSVTGALGAVALYL